MMSNPFRSGQRWASESEPELGLGLVVGVTDRIVTIQFEARGETREYALENAPLRRVRFRAGDKIKSQDNALLIVESVSEENGLLRYHSGARELLEAELSDALTSNEPAERLLDGQLDPVEVFDLRLAALRQQHRRRQSKVRGFVGGRIDLIPHQLYIAAEVAGRLLPRVLLADEVGLGKTIEACLIVHRLIQTGRAQRVLVLVPESLIHQWFVELLRRFNLWFHIFDEERCQALETADPDVNPFLDDQLVLSSFHLFRGNERRAQQVVAAEWDILVVDEAHHLGWSVASASPEYQLVEALGRAVPGLLLLTATPGQLGMASHFARLRLLDPDRYYDLAEFIREAEHYRDVAGMAEKLLSRKPLSPDDTAILARILMEDEAAVRAKLDKIETGAAAMRDELIENLLDRHGTGRVMFRNTRATTEGFPKRTAHMRPLVPLAGNPGLFDNLAEEFAADTDRKSVVTFEPDFTFDPRIATLAELLRNLVSEKVLLICRTQRKVEAIEAALRKRINVKVALFHEGLPLIQRDRNAAWFAEEEGARLLICSEIGSEGRNFQFAHHLVLFDLPLDPELLEQRIGRLDRIGQTAEIHVYVPFTTDSSQEVLARWYHEGLNAFEKNLRGGHELLEKFESRVRDLAQDFHETQDAARTELEQLIGETRAAALELAARLEKGRDRLLELNSFRFEAVAKLIREIRRQDDAPSLDAFLLAVLDHYNIHFEELSQRTYQLGSAGIFADSFPGVPSEGLTLTCDRMRALAREDIQFLTWDHPLVTGALDLLLGSETGTSSFALWPDAKVVGWYLEGIFLLECLAPPRLHVDRFLPPTPLRIVVDHRGQDASAVWTAEALARNLKNGEVRALLERPALREDLLPSLLESAQALAKDQASSVVAQARTEMNAQLGHEISRMSELKRTNPNVQAEEIELLLEHQRTLDQHLASARLRLDAVRLIQRGPPC
ncbi:MAG: RNA polymerase-associated protein RapA [Verrucomicrobiales bacterium]|nr:RNA polymerase-associated protein RapA [Verrucomicrobiales bacterium]